VYLEKELPLTMGWELYIHNRVNFGFCLGWAWYPIESDFDHSEFILFLGLVSLNLKMY